MERAGAKRVLPVVTPPASSKRNLLACFFAQNGTLAAFSRLCTYDCTSQLVLGQRCETFAICANVKLMSIVRKPESGICWPFGLFRCVGRRSVHIWHSLNVQDFVAVLELTLGGEFGLDLQRDIDAALLIQAKRYSPTSLQVRHDLLSN